MKTFSSILVDIDATDRAQPALDRAVTLARASGARLTIVDVMSVPPYARRYLPADLEEETVERRRVELARVAATVSGVRVESRVLNGRPWSALVDEISASGHDLIVRERARDLVAPRREPSGAVEMELVRRSPCPVLLVGAGGAPEHQRIAAAVNTSTEEEEEQALNVRIAELAVRMAEFEGGSVTLLHAWSAFGEGMVRGVASDDGFATYLGAARERSAEDFARFTRTLGAPSRVRSELRRGEPEDVIPEFVVAEGIDLLVMGATHRPGMLGRLLGSTAQRLLPKLACSVLVVKPDEGISTNR